MFCSKEIVCVSDAFIKLCRTEHKIISKFRTISKLYPRLKVNKYSVAIEPAVAESPLHFICVRRLVKRTGVVELVDAFNLALDLGELPINTKLTIIGTGPLYGELKLRIYSTNYASNYSLLGRVSDDQRDALFLNSDWNIVPTQGLEGFGLVILEAAFMGCPSMVTNVNALPEVIGQLNNMGHIIERDVSSIGSGLGKLKRLKVGDRERLRNLTIERFGVSGVQTPIALT